MKNTDHTERRDFLTKIVGGAAAFGLTSIITPLTAEAGEDKIKTPLIFITAETWFKQLKGKHKMVFDWPKHNNGAALSWALTLMDTYNEMGIPDKDISVVLILRYGTTPIALADPLWAKYGFGKRIDLKDPETKEFTLRNLYSKCATEDDDCIELFQKRGGLVGVCSQALDHSSDSLAESLKIDKEEMRKEFNANLLPGIQRLPSGIWAVNRAQELGCKFCFGG
jgi:hypothetical protein